MRIKPGVENSDGGGSRKAASCMAEGGRANTRIGLKLPRRCLGRGRRRSG